MLSSKHLNDLPPRVLRFRLRMAKFDYSISYVPGKLLYEVEVFVDSLTETLPATERRLEMYRHAQKQDETCSPVREYCRTGWPKKQLVPLNLLK